MKCTYRGRGRRWFVFLLVITNMIICDARTNLRACWRLTETIAWPSDARIATAVSHLIGVFFSCAQFLQISRTLVELHWAHRRGTTTTLLSVRALPKNGRCVHSICQRRPACPPPSWLRTRRARANLLVTTLNMRTLNMRSGQLRMPER